MLRPMAGYVKAEQRRAQARAAALRVLGRGEVGFDGLSLRHVAQEMDVPLSTLAYAYPSTRVLFEDLTEEYNRTLWDTLEANVRGLGLQEELRRAADWFVAEIMRDAAHRALVLRQVLALAQDGWSQADYNSERAAGIVRVIAERSAEHYRVPDEVLGNAIYGLVMGESTRWMAGSGEHVVWSTLRAGFDGLTLLADPRPLGQPHPEPAPLDYLAAPLPGST